MLMRLFGQMSFYRFKGSCWCWSLWIGCLKDVCKHSSGRVQAQDAAARKGAVDRMVISHAVIL